MKLQFLLHTIRRIRKAIDPVLNAFVYVNSTIILTFLFFMVLTPLGLLYRLFGKSVLAIRANETSWVRRHKSTPLDKPF